MASQLAERFKIDGVFSEALGKMLKAVSPTSFISRPRRWDIFPWQNNASKPAATCIWKNPSPSRPPKLRNLIAFCRK